MAQPTHTANPIIGFFRAVLAVLSAFVGIRKRKSADSDVSLHPLHFVAAGIFLVALFITVLLFVVKFVLQFAQ